MKYPFLIGKPLVEAVRYLEEQNIAHEIIFTQGKKDRELLIEPYVVAVREGEFVQLVVCNFLTKIGG